MNGRFKSATLLTTLCAGILIAPCSPRLLASPAASPQESESSQFQQAKFEQRALAADHAFVEAATKSDTAALDKLLDVRFTWTSTNGKTLTRQAALQQTPTPAISDANAQITAHNYGSLESIQVHSGKDHALHIWVNRSAGWRLLVYQEVRLLDTLPANTPGTSGIGGTCDNPCKAIPYEPKTQNEHDVVSDFLALQTYTFAHDSANWVKYVADEFESANSNNDQTLTKRGRMEDLERSKMAGYRPMPIVDMRILDFGAAAILISKDQPENGKPLHITRVWIKRDGRWMEAASYQTRIEDAIVQ